MSFSSPYTYGKLTKSQIDALTGMGKGDTVWNSDLKKPEWYDGNIWLNADCIKLKAAETLALGDVVVPTLQASEPSCEKSDSANANTVIGVVYRGASSGNYAAIAFKGIYQARISNTANAATFLNCNASGQATSQALPNKGTFATLMTDSVAGELYNILIWNKPEYY